MHTAYIALGTNLGDKPRNLRTALSHMVESIGTLSAISSVHTSEPWGYTSTNTYLNQVVRLQTPLSPHPLLHALHAIEQCMGRTPRTAPGYQDRIIDLDIILYDNLALHTPELTLPHPHYRQRPFVLDPLNEILADTIQSNK
jgi:2-amino-4-hydroxy-6-hydroxymethyldihydropteridine diphosphokinase